MKLLIIEDEVIQKTILECIFRRDTTLEVVFASTLEEADELVEDADFVVLDLILPDATQLVAIEWLANCRKPCLVCSVDDSPEIIEAITRAGAMGFLSKNGIGEQIIGLIHFTLAREELDFERVEQRIEACHELAERMRQRAEEMSK